MTNPPQQPQQQQQQQQHNGQQHPHQHHLQQQRRMPEEHHLHPASAQTNSAVLNGAMGDHRTTEAAKQLFCGGLAGSVAKTITAPFSRLTILFQVHSMVTTKGHRPKFAMSLSGGVRKIIERGGVFSLWRGNMTSVLHRFPYSAINFYVYEHTMDYLSGPNTAKVEEKTETRGQLVRRVTKIVLSEDYDVDDDDDDDNGYHHHHHPHAHSSRPSPSAAGGGAARSKLERHASDETPASRKFLAGAVAGTTACMACYPLDLVRTRLTTEFEGHEHYRGILDAFRKIYTTEGFMGFYSGIGPTMCVAVPNFAISYTVYGTLKEYTLDDELFYNLRRINDDSGEPKLGFLLTVLCGAASGTLATLVTFPMDTIRRRMQIQNLHIPPAERMNSAQQLHRLITKEGLTALYRGLTPELLKVIPMVGSMFTVYEWAKDTLNV